MTTHDTYQVAALPLKGIAGWGAGIALVLLMVLTRGQHVVSVNALPSASWAVFFLAGLMLRPAWFFAALFALASLLDFGSLAAGTIAQWCVSPAYWALLPAYASLWLAGRWLAPRHRVDLPGLVRLALVLALVTLVAYVFSGGGFYFFSGRYPAPTLGGFGERIVHYYAQRLGTLAGYAGVGVAVHALVAWLVARRPQRQASGA